MANRKVKSTTNQIPEGAFGSKEAARRLGVSLFTMDNIVKKGLLKPFYTPGGHRRFTEDLLEEYKERSRRQWSSTPTTSEVTPTNLALQEVIGEVIQTLLTLTGSLEAWQKALLTQSSEESE